MVVTVSRVLQLRVFADSATALGVLITNVLVLLAAGTLTVSIQRMIRARQERHAPV